MRGVPDRGAPVACEPFMRFTGEEPVVEWIEEIVEDKRRRGVVA